MADVVCIETKAVCSEDGRAWRAVTAEHDLVPASHGAAGGVVGMLVGHPVKSAEVRAGVGDRVTGAH